MVVAVVIMKVYQSGEAVREKSFTKVAEKKMMAVYRSGEAVRAKEPPSCGNAVWKKDGEAKIGTGTLFKGKILGRESARIE